MSASITLAQLGSRVIRSSVGQRTIKPLQRQTTIGAIIGWVVEGAQQLGNFILRAIGFTGFSFAAVLGVIFNVVRFIWTFNWNISDEQLRQNIQSNFESVASLAGGTLGNALGYLSCGVLPSAVIYAFNPALGALALKNVAEEMVDEFVGNLQSLTVATFQLGTQIVLSWLFSNARRLIKNSAEAIGNILGDRVENIIKAWGNGSEAWSMGNEFEEWIESIENQALENFTEELAEELIEGCVEAGFVVANTADQFYAQQKLNELAAIETQDIVILQPNRNVPDNKIVLAGTGGQIRQHITSALVTHQIMDDRDVGVIYGTDDEMPVRGTKPGVILKFYERKQDRIIGQGANGQPVSSSNPASMKISFRLMDKSERDFENINYARQLAQRIHQIMATPPRVIEKGRELYTYNDFAKGYQFKLWVQSQSEAVGIIRDVLNIQSHSYDSGLLRVGSRSVSPEFPVERVTVFGEQEEVPRRGQRIARCTFTHSFLNIGNGTKPINLVDLTGRRRNVVFSG